MEKNQNQKLKPAKKKKQPLLQTKSSKVMDKLQEQNRLDKAIEEIVSKDTLAYVTTDLTSKWAVLLMDCMMTRDDDDKKPLADWKENAINPHERLRYIILKNYHTHFNKAYSTIENVEYIHDELVGTGFVERLLLEDPSITDIEWDADHLRVVSNDMVDMVNGSDIGFDEKAANRLIQRFVVANNTEFNQNQALFNGTYGNIRMSATHRAVSPNGTSFSLRLTRPRLALNEVTWAEQEFAPEFVRLWLQKVVFARSNIVIAGETGSGKTELQKYILGFANPRDKFYVIEDVYESHLKELYPERLIISTLTNSRITITDQIKQALRNNPEYIIVSETRGSEAFEMLQAALSSHTIITTVHAKDARAIPRRFINMCMSGYDVSEEMLTSDIYTYFDFGIHLKAMVYNNKKVRYLSEFVEYNADGTATTLFKQRFVNGSFVYEEIGAFSEEIHKRLEEVGIKVPDGEFLCKMLRSKGVYIEAYEKALAEKTHANIAEDGGEA